MPLDDSSLDNLSKDELERLKIAAELKLKHQELKDKKSWIPAVVSFLGVPAAVLAIVVSITSAVGNLRTSEKTGLESAQLRDAQTKAAQAKTLVNDLTEKSKESPKAFQQSLAENSDQLKEALKNLGQIQVQTARLNVQRSVLKFVLLWILFYVIGLVFDVINIGWRTSISAITQGLYTWVDRLSSYERADDDPIRERRQEERRRLAKSVRRIIPIVAMIVTPLPMIFRLSLQLSIFTTLLGPLFNEITASFGSNVTFAAVLNEAKHLHFAKMLTLMREALFGMSGGGSTNF